MESKEGGGNGRMGESVNWDWYIKEKSSFLNKIQIERKDYKITY